MKEILGNSKRSGIRLFAPMVGAFFVLFFIEFVEFFSPFSGYGSEQRYYLYLGFYLFFMFLVLFPLSSLHYQSPDMRALNVPAKFSASTFLWLAVIGVVFILVDRVLIQGVDYSKGFSAARENWREISTERSGVSSPLSVLGSLLYPLVFLSLTINVIFYDVFRRPIFSLFIGFLVVLSFSLLIGGRTSILVFVSIVFSALLVRVMLGFSFLPRKTFFKLLFFLVVGLFFSSLVFFWRMQDSGVGFASYSISLATRHGGYISGDKDLTDASLLEALWYSISVYVSHVKWVFQSALADGADVYGNAFLNQVFWILSSRGGLDLNVIGFDLNWENRGKWISLPGAVWHDYGALGLAVIMLFFSMLYLLLAFSLTRLSRFSPKVGVGLITFSSIFFAFFVMSPFASLFGVVEFIYLFFDSVVIMIFYIIRRELTRL